MADTVLKDTVVKAFEEVTNVEDTKVEETTKVETSAEEETESDDELPADDSTDSEVIEIEATADEINKSLALQRNLLNPEKRAAILEQLAKDAGYNLTKPEEAKKFKKDTKALFREKLGDIYDLVGGDNLADAIDSVISEQVVELTKPALEKVAQQEQAANMQKADAAMTTFFAQNKIEVKDREGVVAKMMKKMATLPPGQGVNAVEYLNDIYTLVSKDVTRVKTTRETVERINKGAKEANRTSGKGSPDENRVIVKVKRLPSLHESVQAAFKNEKLEME